MTTQWSFLPIQWPERREPLPKSSPRRAGLLFSRKWWIGCEGTCAFRPVCHRRLRSRKFESGSSSYALNFLQGQHFFRSNLLTLFHLFRVSVDVEKLRPPASAHGRWSRAGVELPGRPPARHIRWGTSLPMRGMAMSTPRRGESGLPRVMVGRLT